MSTGSHHIFSTSYSLNTLVDSPIHTHHPRLTPMSGLVTIAIAQSKRGSSQVKMEHDAEMTLGEVRLALGLQKWTKVGITILTVDPEVWRIPIKRPLLFGNPRRYVLGALLGCAVFPRGDCTMHYTTICIPESPICCS